MYHIFGVEENLKNCYRVVYPYLTNPSGIDSINDLRTPYLKFLENQQPDCPVNHDDNPFISDEILEHRLAVAYSEGSLDDLKQSELIGDSYGAIEKQRKIGKAILALRSLFEMDDVLAALFRLVIHSIFTKSFDRSNGSRGTHGGSSSGAIGVIWLTVNDQVTTLDLMELFLHELTHHLIFLDELNTPQFNYQEIRKPENYSCSAILGLQRPMDKVVHSIIVATELILARQSILNIKGYRAIHPPTQQMINNVIQASSSIDRVQNRDEALKPRARELVSICVDRIQSL